MRSTAYGRGGAYLAGSSCATQRQLRTERPASRSADDGGAMRRSGAVLAAHSRGHRRERVLCSGPPRLASRRLEKYCLARPETLRDACRAAGNLRPDPLRCGRSPRWFRSGIRRGRQYSQRV